MVLRFEYENNPDEAWYEVTETYTKRSLTEPKDKFPAISGIAKDVQKRRSQAYYAGIWANHLVRGLLWLPTQHGLCRPSVERAPSWSWAPFDGAIQHFIDHDILRSDFRFIDLQRTLPTQGQRCVDWPEGPGSLTIQASMKKIPFLQLPPKHWKKPSGVR